MQGLVNFSTAIADGISVLLPAFCYIAACVCFFYFAWTLRSMAYHGGHPLRMRPWVPFVSLGAVRRVRILSDLPDHGQRERRNQRDGIAHRLHSNHGADSEQRPRRHAG